MSRTPPSSPRSFSTPPRGGHDEEYSTPPTDSAHVHTEEGKTADVIDPEEEDRKNRLDYLESFARDDTPGCRMRTWDTLLNGNFFVSEIHTHLNPKRFIIENMELFKSFGYTHFFLEHISSELIEDLERYRAQNATDTPDRLKRPLHEASEGYLDSLEQELIGGADKDYLDVYKSQSKLYNYEVVNREATRQGILVIPLEINQKNYEIFKRGKDRAIYFNSNTVRVVTDTVRTNPGAKYFGLIGASHALGKFEVPGVCDTLGVQDVMICDQFDTKLSERAIYDCSMPALLKNKNSIIPEGSGMILVTDIRDGIRYNEDIMPFYNSIGAPTGLTSQESVPQSVIRALSNPEMPKKRTRSK